MATLFSATYPESTVALALFHPSLLEHADNPSETELTELRERWGT